MQTYIPRFLGSILKQDLQTNPIVVLLGPRQCGKTTLVQSLGIEKSSFVYLDLERPRDLRQLADPELFLEANKDSTIILDEIQNLPELFPMLRGFVDRHQRKVQILLLGSSSPDLLKKSAESLAGRVVYRELTPLMWQEISLIPTDGPLSQVQNHWFRGGYPLSFLATSDQGSYDWRESFAKTIITRDIPALGIKVSPLTLERFFRMVSLQHGQTINLATLGNSLGVSSPTIRYYLELLEGTFHLGVLQPWIGNQTKRLIKTPKVYVRDSGLLHTLWEATHFNDLLAHPLFGASWEGYVLEQIIARFPFIRTSFYRTASGIELDLVLEYKQRRLVVETKATTAPQLTRGFWTALEDLKPELALVVAPVDRGWPLKAGVQVVSLPEALKVIEDCFA